MSLSEELKKLIHLFNESDSKEEKIEINDIIKDLINKKRDNEEVNLSNTEIIGIDFSGLNLSAADFSECTIKKVNFSGCILTHAVFSSKSFRKHHEISADFTDATCLGTHFGNCDLRHSNFDSVTMDDARFKSAWLSRKVLSDLLPHAMVKQGVNPKISLDEISLQDADLSHMNLSNLYLRRVYYKGANLMGTKFNNTDVYGSFFSKAKNFKFASVEKAINSDRANYSDKTLKDHREHQLIIKGVPKLERFFTLKRKPDENSDSKNHTEEKPLKRTRTSSTT